MKRPTVYVVDDDYSARDGLRTLLITLDVDVKTFSTAEEFLSAKQDSEGVCLIAEVHLPGLTGVELLEHLNELKVNIPTIILDSGGDLETAVRAMRAGVIDYIEKPFVDRLLVKRVCDVLGLSLKSSLF